MTIFVIEKCDISLKYLKCVNDLVPAKTLEDEYVLLFLYYFELISHH